MAPEGPAGSVLAAVSAVPESSTQPCYRHPDRNGGVRCQRCDRAICPQCMHQASVGFHCPECTKTGQQKVYTRANLQALNRPVVTQALVAINVVVFLLGLGAAGGNGLTETGGRFFEEGALFGPLVAEGEWWRLITSGFLHANLLHLALNMVLLFQLGGILEPALGKVRFAAVYFTSLLCGSFGVMVLDPNSPTVGASGAVFGLMGALFIAQRARGINPWASGIGPLLIASTCS